MRLISRTLQSGSEQYKTIIGTFQSTKSKGKKHEMFSYCEPQLLSLSLYIHIEKSATWFFSNGVLPKNFELIVIVTRKPAWARQYATYRSSPGTGSPRASSFIGGSSPDFIVMCVFTVYSAGLLFWAWWWFFLRKHLLTKSCCYRFLLKRASFYFLHHS
jgi:hypothetical protein